MPGGRTLLGSSIVPLRFVFLMWLFFVVDFFYGYDLRAFGILPRTLHGAIGIVAAPLLHGGYIHILSNTFPLIFLGIVLFYYYNRIASRVFLSCYFITNILVWLFGRPETHIGASGLVYGLAAFLLFFGFVRRDFKSLFISLVVLILYGSIFYGVLPTDPRISWESHLAGAIVGAVTAYRLRGVKA